MADRKDLSYFEKRYKNLLNERKRIESTWDDVSRYIMPYRSKLLGRGRDSLKTKDKAKDIYDNTATLALENLTNALEISLTSPAKQWFHFKLPDDSLNEVVEVAEWLEAVEQALRSILNKSNLYYALPLVYKELGAFGTASVLVLPDEKDVVRFYPLTVGEYAIGTNDRMDVDTIYRETSMIAYDIIKRFGEENCSDAVKTAFDNGSLDTFSIVHAIEPIEHKGVIGQKYKYTSAFYEKGNNNGKFLKVSGFHEFPAPTARWSVPSGYPYGVSPAMLFFFWQNKR